jgi:hypothetical protein
VRALVVFLGKIALIIAALPIALFAGLFLKGRKCTPEELALELRRLAEGDMSGWDELECVPLKDRRLESIRQEATKVELPLRAQDQATLKALAEKAEALDER